MKTNINIIKYSIINLLAAVAVALWTPDAQSAEVKTKGGAGQLMKPVKSVEDLAAIQPGDMMVMSCPKCKTVTVSYVEPTFKATETKEKVKTQHTCPGCNTVITVEGHGKAKKDVVKHVCGNCGSHDAFCCTLKKASEVKDEKK